MKHIIVALLLLFPLAANAQLSDEMLAILAMEELAKTEALDAKQVEFAEAVPDSAMKLLCRNATVATKDGFERIMEVIQTRSPSPVYENMSVGEFAFFADCDGNRNALEHNVIPDNIQYDHTGISDLTKYMIEEMGLLLKEEGQRGLTPTEFVRERIRAANDNNNRDLAITYNEIRITIQGRLMELEAEQ